MQIDLVVVIPVSGSPSAHRVLRMLTLAVELFDGRHRALDLALGDG